MQLNVEPLLPCFCVETTVLSLIVLGPSVLYLGIQNGQKLWQPVSLFQRLKNRVLTFKSYLSGRRCLPEWRPFPLSSLGVLQAQSYLHSSFDFWCCSNVLRAANSMTHNVATWASLCKFVGPIPIMMLFPPFCTMGSMEKEKITINFPPMI